MFKIFHILNSLHLIIPVSLESVPFACCLSRLPCHGGILLLGVRDPVNTLDYTKGGCITFIGYRRHGT